MTERDDDTVDPDLVGVLKRLGAQRGGRIPYVQQLEAADCGAACLAMAAAYHGRALSLDQARALVGTARGTNAAELTRGAEQLGLRTRGVRLELDALRFLPRGSILHWGLHHFVILDRTRRRSVDIVDPAFGRRSLPLDHVSKHFTGVALVFEPSHTFEATPPGRSKIWRYLSQLAAHPALIARVLVTSVALRVLALALPILTALVVDRVVPRGDRDLLVVVGGGIAIALGFQLLSTLIRSHLLIELRTKLDIKLTMNFVAQLLSLPYAFFHRRSAGDLLLRISSNTQIRDLLTSSLLSTLLDGALAIGYLVLLVILSPTLALVTVLAGSLQLVVVLVARHRYAALLARDLESQARAHSYLVQMLVGIETLKVAGAEDRALEHWGNLYVDELNVALQRSRLTAITDGIAALLQTAAPLLLLGAGALLVLDHQLSLGTMLATTALATGFLAPLANLLQSALQLQLLGRYVERLEDVFAAEPEQQRASAIAPPRLTGAIEVQRVSFRYGPNEPLVVRDVNLAIAPGTTTAIVGRSGSGKSTLAALLLGIHRPGDGRISYDGYDVAELDRKLLRRQLGVVPQSPFMFSGSIRANIALADPALPLDIVIAAARLAGIDAEIRAMAMGYDTIISDGGSTLSGGQRQRLALARALVHQPAVLLLDEATSSLDATTERAVMDQLRTLPATRILIAHRLSTIIHADQIVVMQDGRIVEIGTHTDLLARRGVYAALVADQTFSPAAPADASPEAAP